MQILPSQKLFGLPALKLRAFVDNHEQFSYKLFAKTFDLKARDAKTILASMAQENYFVAPKLPMGKWELAINGRRLRVAKAVNKISRLQAEVLLADFFERVRHINQNPDFLIEVDEVWLVGSMLENVEFVSDVDLAVTCRYKEYLGSYAKNLKRVYKKAEKEGQDTDFWTMENRLTYGKVRRFLKQRKRHLSLGDSSLLELPELNGKQLLYKALPA